jgi:hypothetical protein
VAVCTAIEAENELVEIGLKVFLAKAVVDAERLGFHIREDAMNPRQHNVGGHFSDDMRIVIDARRAWLGGPSVGFDRRAGSDVVLDESMQRFGGKVGDFREANTAHDAIRNLYRASDEHLALSASSATSGDGIILGA